MRGPCSARCGLRGSRSLRRSETSSLGPTTEPVGGLSFLYHNVLLLRYIEQDSEVGRAVAILKMRNSGHEKGLWKFVITDRGFQILEKLEGVSGLLGWSVLSEGQRREPGPFPAARPRSGLELDAVPRET